MGSCICRNGCVTSSGLWFLHANNRATKYHTGCSEVAIGIIYHSHPYCPPKQPVWHRPDWPNNSMSHGWSSSVDIIKRRFRRAALLQKARRPEPYHQIWNNNTYVRDINHFASLLNLSDCWVCTHIPPQSKSSGILLHGIPVNASYKISNNMKDNRTSSPPVSLSLVEIAPHCFRFNRSSNKFLGHYPYCNWTYEYVNGSSCFLNVTTMSGRPKVSVNNVPTYMTYDQQAACRDFYVWFNWMRKSSKSTYLLQSDLWLFCGKLDRSFVFNSIIFVLKIINKKNKTKKQKKVRNERSCFINFLCFKCNPCL
ncbi:uncharacterized protein LOC144327964 [Podarcis muralis]